MLGAGGGKGDGDGFIHLPDFLYRLHAGHAVHVNVHQQQIEFAGAERFQQFLTAGELGANGGDGGLFQQGEQGFPYTQCTKKSICQVPVLPQVAAFLVLETGEKFL